MNPQDKTCLENIYKVFVVLPNDKRQYLMGVADGLAASSPAPPTVPTSAVQPHA